MSSAPKSTTAPSSSHASADATPAKPRKRRTITLLVLLALVIVGLWLGVPYYHHRMSHEATDDAFLEGTVVAVSPRVAGHVKLAPIEANQWVKEGDLLFALDDRDLAAALASAEAELRTVEARLATTHIDKELTVITGDATIAESSAGVDAAAAQVSMAEADVVEARSAVAEARSQVAVATAGLDAATADAAAAEAVRDRDAGDLKRFQEMAGSNAVTPQQLDHAQAAARTSAAMYDAAQKRIAIAQATLAKVNSTVQYVADGLPRKEAAVVSLKAQLEQAKARFAGTKAAPRQVALSEGQIGVSEARLEAARAAVAQAKLALSHTVVRAPCSGYVTRKMVEVGTYVQPGQALLILVQPDVWVVANYKETQLTNVRPGQSVAIKIDTYPDAVFKGRVHSIQRGTGARFSLLPPENATGNFIKVTQRVPVKIVFDGPQLDGRYLLVPGMSVEPEIDLNSDSTEQVPASSRPTSLSTAAPAETSAPPASTSRATP